VALATQADVWTYDVARATRSPLTTDASRNRSPLWAVDGKRIFFTSLRAGYPQLFSKSADGTGMDTPFLTASKDLLNLRADSWSADGTRLLVTETQTDARALIAQVLVEDPSNVQALLKGKFRYDSAAVSPNGRWIAYHAGTSSGSLEVYVERYPELGDRQVVSTEGGTRPMWSRNGTELFFSSLDGTQMLAVAVQPGAPFRAARPQVLFQLGVGPVLGSERPYDITPEGRFLVIRNAESSDSNAASNLILVQNWTEELKRLVPPK
jgi:Tol biopolymer transport system component